MWQKFKLIFLPEMYCQLARQFQFPLCCALIMLSTLAEPESSRVSWHLPGPSILSHTPGHVTRTYEKFCTFSSWTFRSKVTDELSKNSCNIHNAAGRPQRSKQHHKRWNLIIEVIIIINHYEAARGSESAIARTSHKRS